MSSSWSNPGTADIRDLRGLSKGLGCFQAASSLPWESAKVEAETSHLGVKPMLLYLGVTKTGKLTGNDSVLFIAHRTTVQKFITGLLW